MRYNTVQRKAIIDFLSENKDKQFSIDELSNKMSALENAPGKSTIYRIITKLVNEGVVRRFVKGQSRRFLYQIAGCEDFSPHLHLKCTACGMLIHLDEKDSGNITSLISYGQSFDTDISQTVIFGTCSGCK